MKVFITGATGYIGHQLARELVLRKHEVVALVRSKEKARELEAAGVKLAIGDLEALPVIEAAMQGVEIVFHLAAYARVWPEDGQIFQKVNVAGTENMLAAALKQKVKKVIFTSTAAVYGPSRAAGELVDETTRRTRPLTGYYEQSKAEAEKLARSYGKKGLPVVILNPARVYGPGMQTESNAISKLLKLYLKGKWRLIPGDGQAVGSYSFIEDVVAGHLLAMEKGKPGENYLLGGENASYDRLFQIIKQVSGKHFSLFHLPGPALLFGSWCLVKWARLTGTTPLITPVWAKKYVSHWGVSSKKAVQVLGYQITPLETGLKKTLEWLQKSENPE